MHGDRSDANLAQAADRLTLAKAIIKARRRRDMLFSDIMVGEPSWEMILRLYVESREDRSIGISDLCAVSGAPATTALRHLSLLETAGYVERTDDPEDRRRYFLQPSTKLVVLIEQWLDREVRESAVFRSVM